MRHTSTYLFIYFCLCSSGVAQILETAKKYNHQSSNWVSELHHKVFVPTPITYHKGVHPNSFPSSSSTPLYPHIMSLSTFDKTEAMKPDFSPSSQSLPDSPSLLFFSPEDREGCLTTMFSKSFPSSPYYLLHNTAFPSTRPFVNSLDLPWSPLHKGLLFSKSSFSLGRKTTDI